MSQPFDGVHLSKLGNKLWAETILKALGLKLEWKK